MTLRGWASSHPEWWTLALSGGAAAALGVLVATGQADARGEAMTMSPNMVMPPGSTMPRVVTPMSPVAPQMLVMYGLMVVVMMLPLTIGEIRVTAARSLWRRRQRAIAGFLLGFLLVWGAVSAAVLAAVWALDPGSRLGSDRTAAALVLALASGWQFTTVKRRALNRHHRTRPLRPRGFAADLDCLRFGGMNGWQCVLSCGPLMAAMALDMASIVLLPVLTGVVLFERSRYRPPRRAGAAVLAALAVTVAVV